MTSPFRILEDEHDQILRGLDLLDSVAERLERDDPAAPRQMLTLVEFIRRYADACHHAKEENVLFDALIEHGLPDEGGPVQVMLAEHAEGRELVRVIADHLDDPEAVPRADAVRAARSFSMLLRDHIRKENEVLFALGRNVIPSALDAELVDAYAKYEASVLSAEDKAELVASLDRLRRELRDERAS